jgi:hypothetical protein
MLAHLHGLVERAASMGAALPLALVFAIALVEAVVLPWRYWAKGAWAVLVVLCGVGAAMLLRWEQQASGAVAADQIATRLATETAALHGLWSQWDELSKSLPTPSGEGPAASFDNVEDALASLSAKVAVVKEQVAALKAGETARVIDPATAVKLSGYLRQYGSYRVVVSCVPADVEAYTYANQLIDIIKSAGWDASGPEQTANVLPGPAMGIMVFDRDPSAPDAAKILLDAFTQFDIPHAVGVTAEYAIPDSATVELFVAKKP